MGNQEKHDLENKNEDPLNYSAGLSSDWRFGGSNVKNTSMGLVPDTNSMVVSKGDLIGSFSCSSSSMVDSFGAAPWNNYDPNSQNLGFCDNDSLSNANQLQPNPLGIAKGGLASLRGGIDRTLDMCWNQPNSMLKGGYYLPNVPVMLPQNLSQLPTDSAFIERAARFSCFGAGNFTDMVNHPFPIPDSVNNPYSKGGGIMLGTPQEVLTCDALKPVSGLQSSSKCELNVGEASKDASVNVENGAIEGSPLKSLRKNESFGKSHDEAKEGMGGSGNESDEAEFSSASQEEPPGTEVVGGKAYAKRLFSKKRKRNTEANNIDGVSLPLGGSSKDNGEMQQKVDQNPITTINKTSGKNCKQVSQASDPSKQEYIHVRARRGQATNSHSLAERVRREKISERMKFLQDLVPGCNKVTGKAVMLDEIINYVQSLQRQVEFLSMKLATVHPRLDFNLEGLLAKDILQPRVGPSHTPAFSQDVPMAYSMLHPSHQGLTQAGLPGVGISSDVLQRPIGSQLTPLPGGFKEPTLLPNVWEDELNNVIQMSYGSGTSAPPNIQDVDGHMKADL